MITCQNMERIFFNFFCFLKGTSWIPVWWKSWIPTRCWLDTGMIKFKTFGNAHLEIFIMNLSFLSHSSKFLSHSSKDNLISSQLSKTNVAHLGHGLGCRKWDIITSKSTKVINALSKIVIKYDSIFFKIKSPFDQRYCFLIWKRPAAACILDRVFSNIRLDKKEIRSMLPNQKNMTRPAKNPWLML